MSADAIGWLSSLVLLATMLAQVRAEWRTRRAGGVSHWLFIGQFAASSGFAIYSLLVGNRVFIATNLMMALSAIAGFVIDRRNRRLAQPAQ